MESSAKAAASSAASGLSRTLIPARPLGPIIVTGAGLILALAATLAAPVAGPVETLGRRVTLNLPDWLVVAALGSALLAAAIGIALALPRPRRRRKKGEDEYEMYQEPRRLPPLLGIALIVLALSPGAALIGALFWFGHNSVAPAERGAIISQHLPFAAPATPGTQSQRWDTVPASPITTGLMATAATLAAFGALAFVAWLGFGDRWRRREGFSECHRAELVRAVDESLEDLLSEPNARLAVQRVYQNFERVMAAAGMPRRLWQTQSEFTRAALVKLAIPNEPARELTRLFEIARFSAHVLGADERERAWRSLTAIRTSIGTSRGEVDGHAS